MSATQSAFCDCATLGSTRFDPQRPVWLSKTHFIMLMRDEKLA
jgi:hypothetical protein